MTTSRILRNASMLGIAQVISMAAGFVSTAWLARMLGPELYGIIGFGTAFVSYFALSVVFGTDLYGTREIAAAPGRTQILFSRILSARLILLFVVGLIYVGVILVIDRPRQVSVVMFIQLLGLLSAAMTVDFLFQGHQRMGPPAIRQSAAALLGMIAVLILVNGPNDVFAAAAIPFSVMCFSAFLLGVFTHRRVVRLGFSFNRRGLRDVFCGSAPLLLAGLMTLVFLNVDVVMLGFLRSAEETGIYAAMCRLFLLSMFVAHIVSSAFSPALAAAGRNLEQMRAIYYRYIRIVIFLGAPICAAMVAFPAWVTLVVFGEEFVEGAGTLSLLQIAAIISYACMAPLTALVSWREQKAQMTILAMVALTNVCLNYWLIPAYGGIGAAIATLAAQGVMFALLVSRVRSKFGLFGFGTPAVAVVCSFVAFFGARFLAEFLLLISDIFSVWLLPLFMVVAALGCYLVLTYAAGVFRRSDLTAVIYVLRNRDGKNSDMEGSGPANGY
ncbi:MAG: flippase [Pseudomonadota bacterium]|nr:flippase [Pseudomonadota bacterium]